MQRLTQLLKNLFALPSPQTPSTTGAEMTLHDVLRICATRMPQQPRPLVAATGYRMVGSDWLEMSSQPVTSQPVTSQPVISLRGQAFGGRLAAYGTDKRDSRFSLIKRQGS